MTEDEKTTLHNLVKDQAAKLAEHFDTVQIFVTKHSGETETTLTIDSGVGNFHARYGQVIEWQTIQEQYQRNHAIRKDAEE